MVYPFREHHLFTLLAEYTEQTLPLDLFISHYYREHKALGSKDRAFIADNVYGIIRWQELLDHLCEEPRSWKKRFDLYQTLSIADIQQREEIAPHIRVSFPEVLFNLIVADYGLEKGIELCLTSNTSAPTTVRANPLKTSREELLAKWNGLFNVAPCAFAKQGITFDKRTALFALPEFQEGLFEVQDEGSQLLAELVAAKPGQLVLDYCAGAGGKTLAFAAQMQNKGQVFLHDIRTHILSEAQKRLRRSGIQNAQVVLPDNEAKLQGLKKKMDWVLVDVPCTGTGTMRRNPDMKWKFTEEILKRLLGQQRMIFEKALSFMHPKGSIVYATCSILQAENQQQIAHLAHTYDLEIVGTPFQSLPTQEGMDGFFGAVLRRKNSSL
jgi:16S rRNA (cytosine967-C5)-methyltransferase